jgi:hypothetical protein
MYRRDLHECPYKEFYTGVPEEEAAVKLDMLRSSCKRVSDAMLAFDAKFVSAQGKALHTVRKRVKTEEEPTNPPEKAVIWLDKGGYARYNMETLPFEPMVDLGMSMKFIAHIFNSSVMALPDKVPPKYVKLTVDKEEDLKVLRDLTKEHGVTVDNGGEVTFNKKK